MPDVPAPYGGRDASKVKRLEQFRIFYNHTIHPELLRMERQRLRLLRLLLFSSFILAGVLLLQFYLDILALTLFLSIPLGAYVFYLLYRVREFRQNFKPNIVNLVLDFIDDGMNFDPSHPLKYEPERQIDKTRFLKSEIFVTDAPYYEGEDFISGRIGEMNFELCELRVRDFSPVRSGLREVFTGVFLYANFAEETHGRIIIWPRRFRQHLTRAIKKFTWEGGKNMDKEVNNEAFREAFLTYATKETHVEGILSPPMQDAIVLYRQQTGKELYMSFLDKEIYAAVTEEKDILEPYIFRSNLSFELIREFFEDINILLRIAEDFDQTH